MSILRSISNHGTRAAALAAGLAVLASLPAAAQDPALAKTLAKRLTGDRTGACIAAAVIDHDKVRKAFVCADADGTPRIGPHSAFEIGSVTKTMTATVLAELINAGKASLADPLTDWLPKGTQVPEWQGQPIRLRDVVTHSSGLPAMPPGVTVDNAADPYADMDPKAVIAALGKVKLHGAPGSRPAYSNFAMMLLSWGIAQRIDQPFAQVLEKHLFQPLGMTGAYLTTPPEGVQPAVGHLPNGKATSAWHFPADMGGVGGVRATLGDMIAYTRAELDPDTGSELGKAIALTHTEPKVKAPLARGINWFIREVDGHKWYFHEGGTGGFSALVMFAPDLERGVVLLCDTSWTALGGLGRLGAHLMDPAKPMPKPRKVTPAPADVLQGLAGQYLLQGGMPMTVSHEGGVLYVQAAGKPRYRMGHDSAGDFYPLDFNALLHPVKAADGSWSFSWRQGGAVLAATRQDKVAHEKDVAISSKELVAYAGTYPLMPGFDLHVSQSDGKLQARATGQGAFTLDYLGDDRFAAPAFGIQLEFQRNDAGEVVSLDLHQAGHVLHGEKQ